MAPPPPGRGAAQGSPSFNALAVTPDQMTRYRGLPPPTLILVTDIHEDHLDAGAIGALRTRETTVVVPSAAKAQVPGAQTIANGQTKTIAGVSIEAAPMYNVRPDPQFGETFHTKGRGNGYILTLGGKRLYIAGDTACTPEMKALKNIEVAFLPMNLPYTMSPAEAAECAKAFMPKIVYPYHYFSSDVKSFEAALTGTGIDVRLRDWYVPVAR